MALVYDLKRDLRFLQGKKQGLEQGLKKGKKEGLELALKIKSGDDGLFVMDRLKSIRDTSTLEQMKGHILNASSVAELTLLIGGGKN